MDELTEQKLLTDVVNRLEALESVVCQNGINQLQESVTELTRIIEGDQKLNVLPLRDTVAELDMAYRRAKWVVGTLVVSNVGGLIGIASLLLGKP